MLTGHTGFKGAWLTLWLTELGAKVTGIALPPEYPNGIYASLEPWSDLESHLLDIRDRHQLRKILYEAQPEIVFHLAAQALVIRGWQDPTETYDVNVVGTSNLLESLRETGSVRAGVVVTSDKVYANKGASKALKESDPLGGSDPYGASKAGAEMVVEAWRVANANVGVATGRAGNVIGGGDVGQHRLLPDIHRSLQDGSSLLLRYPTAIRPWQFVLEPLAGYLELAEHLVGNPQRLPAAFNFGPDVASSRMVSQVAESAFELWGDGCWKTSDDQSPALLPEAPSLKLDASLAKQELGWAPRLDLDAALSWTVDWWKAQRDGSNLRSLALRQISAYEDLLVG